MKFSEWKLLNEKLNPKFLDDEAFKVKSLLNKDFKVLYSIPAFDIFKRKDEPEQHRNLFTDDQLNTFALNYTMKGDLYSIDVWNKNEYAPAITYYVERGNIEQIAPLIPNIVKKPVKPNRGIILKEENSTVVLNPKPAKPTTALELRSEKNEYDFSDIDTVFEDLETYVDMVINHTQPSLLITGSPGVGKTFIVLKQMKEANLKDPEDYIHVKGRSTAAGMFITLYENNGKIVVFDDCDSVFGNEDAKNILKGALDSYNERKISWLVGNSLKTVDGEKVPKSFIFTGGVIFISNLPQRKIDDAIKSRSFVIEVALSPSDMLKKMKRELPNVYPEIPLSLRENALEFIEEVASKAKHLELNMRTLVKAIKILNDIKNLKTAERLILQQCSYK